jgi:hypothetical protein
MFLQINEINVQDNGRIDMRLEYDETFRQGVARHFKKENVSKKEIMSFILEKLEDQLAKDSTLIARLNDSETSSE